jgi:hypothetical protein
MMPRRTTTMFAAVCRAPAAPRGAAKHLIWACLLAGCGGASMDDAPAGAGSRMVAPLAVSVDPSSMEVAPSDAISSPDLNFPGITAAANPPDTVGDVGPNHFVQMVNATFFQIWDKAGNALTGALNFGALWPAGDNCASNTGDPIVVYDHLADRWLLSQFARPNHMCIAISQTPDPTTGQWFLYEFDTGEFPDYPKFGVWPDAYYMSSYESPDLGIYAFDRDNMLLGNPAANPLKTTIDALGAPGVRDTRILPSDLDGPAPPAGTPNFFVRTVDDQQDPGNPTDRIEVYTAAVDWNLGTLAFTLTNTLAPAAFDMMVCNRNGQGVRDCIPQPDTVDTVDALSNRPMMQLNYRRFGAHDAMVFNQTIDARALAPFMPANELAGIRWYELRDAGAGWSIFQQGTHAPNAGATAEAQLVHRWMGSAAMDRKGNMALGYSVVNGDSTDGQEIFPGIRYAGRELTDPLGTLPQPEMTILAGTSSQGDTDMTVEPQRWGDYSALTVDPVDGCTFWYTTHVAGIGGTGSRPTRVATFSFESCNEPPVAKCKDVTKPADDDCLVDVLASEVDDGSFDPDGDSFTCVLSPVGPFTVGATSVTLDCTDAFGETGSCTATVTIVDTTPPVFTSVPPDITVTDCSAPDIGQATATDNCGPVSISNDAPALFPLGVTTVTWTAADPSGNATTATQDVTALLKDDPSCCPAGTNILLGTPEKDTLIGTHGSDCILGLAGDDNINGQEGDDFISGGDGDDNIVCGGGDDLAMGWGGDDHINAGQGDDEVNGGEGDDRVNAGTGSDAIDGGPDQDRCTVPGDGADVVLSCEE